jgi:hypothetical protein
MSKSSRPPNVPPSDTPHVERPEWMGDHLWALIRDSTPPENAEALAELLDEMKRDVEAEQTQTSECPSWCTLPAGHDWDSVELDGRGRTSRGHQGPEFGLGGHVCVCAFEYADAPGVLEMHVNFSDSRGDLNEMTAEQSRALAQSLIEAAAWLEANPS